MQMQRTVGILVEMEVDIYPKTKKFRNNVLYLAAMYRLPCVLILFLSMETKLNVNARNAQGETPLHVAARRWRWDYDRRCFDVLIDAGANLALIDNDGVYPLDVLLVPDAQCWHGNWQIPLQDLKRYILMGARFGKNTRRARIIPEELREVQRNAACCRLAARALALVLRKRGVHRNVIPLITAEVEKYRECRIWQCEAINYL